MIDKYDVIIIGAGAAGMMCATESGKRGRKVLLVDHAKKIGEKIRISGGGRCNFTNTNTHPSKFISKNPKFTISALSQYTQNDFINLIKKHNIKFHEKKLGQLFCDQSAQQIVDMLLLECQNANVSLMKETTITEVLALPIKLRSFSYFSKSIAILSAISFKISSWFSNFLSILKSSKSFLSSFATSTPVSAAISKSSNSTKTSSSIFFFEKIFLNPVESPVELLPKPILNLLNKLILDFKLSMSYIRNWSSHKYI